MIHSLRGKLIHSTYDLAVVECGGVGYACQIPLSTYNEIGGVGDEVFLYTYLNIRQDGLDLFGFASTQEVSTFKLLTGVSGVGAKAGLAVLSQMTPESVALAVVTGDTKAFTRCNGIGNKIASRIVLELKDKFKNSDFASVGSKAVSNDVFIGSEGISEAIAALMSLGYSQSEAASALSGEDITLPSDSLIKIGLKKLALG